MVELTRRQPLKVFRVFDRDGRPIGQVVQPRHGPVVGRGARTVLLLRSEECGAQGRAVGSMLHRPAV
jgi:hypothetical protein